jgi:hypothetical protein
LLQVKESLDVGLTELSIILILRLREFVIIMVKHLLFRVLELLLCRFGHKLGT